MGSDEAIRVRLGARPDTTPDVLRALAADVSVTVRAALAMNPATPAETNVTLARDTDERVRALLARKLGALAPALSSGALSRLRQQTLDALNALADDETVRVRAAIADVVKDLPDAPRDLILRLAHDEAVQVCEPVIRFSPLLTSDDLVALVAAAPSSGTRLAVARRSDIDAAVSDAVASGGTEDVVLALLMNGSAQIREATLDALVDRSEPHPAWHAPLVRRPVLSDRSARALSWIVAEHLLEILAARGDLDPALTAELRAGVSKRLGSGASAASGEDADPPGMEPDPAIPPAKPTEADVLAAARDGDERKAARALALAAGVPISTIRRAASLRSAKALVSLVWKAGWSMKAGHAMQVLLARLAPGTVLKPGPGNSFPLSVEEMSWQLDFLNGKEG
jgi:uncharacterized protein (DUF2336 family)